MTEDLLASLKAIDLAILTDVVRQDQGSSSFEISEWSVRRLSDKGANNPDGLWLYSGVGTDPEGSRPWSVVLKTIRRSEQETKLSDLYYWKRELLLAHSGLTERLPGPIKAPRFYKGIETPDGGWLLMEQVRDKRPGPWALEDYAFAACQLGAWNGKYLTGTVLPDEPWLGRQLSRSWQINEEPEKVWQFPLHQKHISNNLRLRCDRLWAEREVFLNILEATPQVFSHFDSMRRNLMIRKDKDRKDELVLIDWAQCGFGPLGGELYALIGVSLLFLEWPLSEVTQLDAAAFGGYLKGLAEVGWQGDVDLVRLGFVAWQAVWFGVSLPYIFTWLCTSETRSYALQAVGLAEEELYLKLLPLLFYSLDCADEARVLMKKLKLI